MAHDAGGTAAHRRPAAPRPSPPFTFLDMPCDLLTCLGPVASTPGYEREVDGTQCLCRTARDDTMLGAATADLRYKRWGGTRSRLAYACTMNDHARVAWLVECGARDVAAAAADGYTGGAALVRRLAGDPLVDATAALVAAVRVGSADVVALLVARGAQLEGALYYGGLGSMTPLRAASWQGHLEVVAALLAAGAAVDAADGNGMTALMHAASNYHLEVVQALVAAGADVNRRMADGASAAALAVFQGREQVAAYLCALPQAVPGPHIAAAAWLSDVQRVRDFIARGASVEERDWVGRTCLMLAAQRGHMEVVRVLLGAGADVAAAGGKLLGSTVLSCAVGHPAILALLLARFEVGGDETRQAQLNTAYAEAVELATPEGEESARMLLAAGAFIPRTMW
jgi:hypothetical protein